ncbi:unnamed protein product [Prorocentrum cordatum]|uniref:Uncharacterized protein n=1 Tax=Prorocentrum cordatum TaxID=2364126 RepID=A0ABN9W7V7_9DINO|nr:unnamed protein product [Polarella glacialis]|mmetsp:Transcript_98611/g.257020  ORF Transcript_98611/g.257020 Transcript_98611/m.257020 type:complete len:488 (+) Transcript_98611:80-1543(+)
MFCFYSLLVVCICCAPSTLSLFVDRTNPAALSRFVEDEYDAEEAPLSPWGPYVPMDQKAFNRDFGEAFDNAHAKRATTASRREEAMTIESNRKKGTVNVVISIRDGADLPRFCDPIMRGDWGEHVSLSIYVKNDNIKFGEMNVMPNGIHEMIQIPNIGRNEHAYAVHLARKAPNFSDVEILTKTNVIHDDPDRMDQMVRYMVDLARNGTYDSVSFPWAFDRRYLNVRCDPAWSHHSLYQEFCGGDQSAKGGLIKTENYKDGSVPLQVLRQPSSFEGLPPDFGFALRTLQQPLPLVHETYGEGMLALRRDVLEQFSADWYREFQKLMYQAAAAKGASASTRDTEYDKAYSRADVKHHDDAMMWIFPLVFSRATPLNQDFPAWLVAPSTVDLFDTVDNMRKFYTPGINPDAGSCPLHAVSDPGCECPSDALWWFYKLGHCHCGLASKPDAQSGRWVKVGGQRYFAVPGRSVAVEAPGPEASSLASAPAA